MSGNGLSIVRLALREIAHRFVSFVLIAVAAAVAASFFLGVQSHLRAYEIRTGEILAQKKAELDEKLKKLQDEMRKATLKLSFNLAILPGTQDVHEWHEKDYATSYMPEEYAERLANSKIVSIRHLLPMLQQKIKWPEQNRTIILIGCKGEVPSLHKEPRTPLVQPVPDGTIALGYELHTDLAVKVGDKVRLMGREFTVHKCHEERGSKDDITAWIPLRDAQELLGKPGLINVILALECVCIGDRVIDRIRSDVAQYLPDTKVIEFGTQVLARGEAREKVRREAIEAMEREKRHQAALQVDREKLAGWALSVVLVTCVAWVFLIALANARNRLTEVAILRALGYGQGQILVLFLMRYLAAGFLGGLVGCVVGLLVGLCWARTLHAPLLGGGALLSWSWLMATFVLGTLIVVAGGWIPALVAASQDPAQILREE
ncbi:MAG: FtsX-like permease family protein [Kiritimatiellae bacterium]|nr:FtsX-like permease family protein [Kiritimatiellia bacterium]